PDAYTKAPSATSALIAPLMTKISIYVMIRILFSVFEISLFIALFPLTKIMVWAGVAAICAGAVMALAQTDFKRMLCYILVAEVGYMVGGLGVANAVAIRGTILHILNDAVMTAGLFTVAGIIMHKIKKHRLADFKGLFQRMPFTMSAFVVCALSMIGVPPTCGFFSKWYLIQGAMLAGEWPFVAALLGSSLINVILFFRIIEVGFGFHSSTPIHTHARNGLDKVDEAPLTMLIPTVGLAAAILLIGLCNRAIVKHIIDVALPKL
ncbi:MAG: monovalent cation/H+ antiporter subunit D family protein, partial [Deltaproteobacteria bacterium]|nr:monovalent cation/H+ antiporter subunit D family protein [Deltaproteobacteria bacterium]